MAVAGPQGSFVSQLRDDIAIEQGRADELEKDARWDNETAKLLRRQSTESHRHADWLRAKANDYSEASRRTPEGDPARGELRRLADELTANARRDEDLAMRQDAAARNLDELAQGARDAANGHRAQAGRMKDLVERLGRPMPPQQYEPEHPAAHHAEPAPSSSQDDSRAINRY